VFNKTSLRYFSPSIPYFDSKQRKSLKKIWTDFNFREIDQFYMLSESYSSGRIIINSSVDVLLAQSYFFNQLPTVVDYLCGLGFDSQKYSFIQQIDVPDFLNSKQFIHIFEYFILFKNIIVLGISFQ
jgi:hypothetical protein